MEKAELTIDAPVPDKLCYSEEQINNFGPPKDHEQSFINDLGKYPLLHLCFGLDPVTPEFITPNYKTHFQTFIAFMHRTCTGMCSFSQMCDIVDITTSWDGQNIRLEVISIRPCAQKMGLFNIILGQLLKICQCTQKPLRINNPVPETLAAVRSIFPTVTFASPCIIPLDLFRAMSNEQLIQTCRLENKVFCFNPANILVINPVIMPSAEDMNDPAAVNIRYDASIKGRSRGAT
jgi:hypothetical protein